MSQRTCCWHTVPRTAQSSPSSTWPSGTSAPTGRRTLPCLVSFHGAWRAASARCSHVIWGVLCSRRLDTFQRFLYLTNCRLSSHASDSAGIAAQHSAGQPGSCCVPGNSPQPGGCASLFKPRSSSLNLSTLCHYGWQQEGGALHILDAPALKRIGAAAFSLMLKFMPSSAAQAGSREVARCTSCTPPR